MSLFEQLKQSGVIDKIHLPAMGTAGLLRDLVRG